MGTFWAPTTSDPLPNDSGLRSGAAQLRAAADTLNQRVADMRSIAGSIGPGVWVDSASVHASSIIRALADELATGSASLMNAANALETLAQYVNSQRARYSQVIGEISNMPDTGIADASHLVREFGLAEEQRSIESGVTVAMAHAAEIIDQCAAGAGRYQYTGGQSLWSRFFGGLEQGTVDLVKSVVGIVSMAAKLQFDEMTNPAAFLHDLEAIGAAVTSIASHPVSFAENLIYYNDFRHDPARWAGEIIPGIVAIFLTKGLGDAAKVGDVAKALPDQVTSNVFTADRIDHIVNGGTTFRFGQEQATGFHVAKDGVPPPGRDIIPRGDPDPNGVYPANVKITNEQGEIFTKFSTMYPKSYDGEQAIRAAEEAFRNSATDPTNPTKWIGESNGGLKIEGYYGSGGTDQSSAGTAYPIYQPETNTNALDELLDLEILP